MEQILNRRTENPVLRFLKWRYTPFLVFLIYAIIIHCTMQLWTDDDVLFAKALQEEGPLLHYYTTRYATWTSRLLLETVLIYVIQVPLLWKILDVAIFVSIPALLSLLFDKGNNWGIRWLFVFLMFLYPFHDMATAGWITTTVNYLWPLAAGIATFLPIKKLLQNEPLCWYHYVINVPLVLFASNQEQCCVIIAALFFFFLIKQIICKKSWLYPAIMLFLCALMLLFIMTCPGNKVRLVSNTEYWLPEFSNLHLGRKMELGFSSTLYAFLFMMGPCGPNYIILAFTFLLFLAALKAKISVLKKIICFFPFGICLLFSLQPVLNWISIFNSFFNRINTAMTLTGTRPFSHLPETIFPDAVLSLICLAIILSMFLVFQNKKRFLFALYIMAAGFITRLAMGFSPTVWASSTRTYLFFYIAIIIDAALVLIEIQENSSVLKMKHYYRKK